MDKYCGGCYQVLPRDAFGRKSNTYDGLRCRCRTCESTASKAYRKRNPERARVSIARWQRENPEKRQANQKRITQRRRAIVYNAKDRPCVDCGVCLPPEVMDLDHVRGEKTFDLSRASAYGTKRIQAELAKCEVRCSNCHRMRHYKENRAILEKAI